MNRTTVEDILIFSTTALAAFVFGFMGPAGMVADLGKILFFASLVLIVLMAKWHSQRKPRRKRSSS